MLLLLVGCGPSAGGADPPPTTGRVLPPSMQGGLVDGGAGHPVLTLAREGLITVGMATVINLGHRASIEAVHLEAPRQARLLFTRLQVLRYDGHDIPIGYEGFPPPNVVVSPLGTPIPRSDIGEDGRPRPSAQLLLVVRLGHRGAFDGVSVRWNDGRRDHELSLDAKVRVGG